MFVSATEVQNNFGKYLKLCGKENIIITKNGKKRAVLLSYPRNSAGYEAGEPVNNYGTSPKKRLLVTYREFLEMTETSEHRYELIDGVVYLLASPGFTHQKILGRLYVFFNSFFKDRGGCSPFLPPFDIELIRQPFKKEREITEDDINVVQPDLVVLCDPQKYVNAEDRYKGTPALAAEIISPSSRGRDTIKKLDLYMESGIGEFWVIDPVHSTVRVFAFKNYDLEEELYYPSPQTAESRLFPGLSVPLTELFAE